LTDRANFFIHCGPLRFGLPRSACGRQNKALLLPQSNPMPICTQLHKKRRVTANAGSTEPYLALSRRLTLGLTPASHWWIEADETRVPQTLGRDRRDRERSVLEALQIRLDDDFSRSAAYRRFSYMCVLARSSMSSIGFAQTPAVKRDGVPLSYVNEKLLDAIMSTHASGKGFPHARVSLLRVMHAQTKAFLALHNLLAVADAPGLPECLLDYRNQELQQWINAVVLHGSLAESRNPDAFEWQP
jgi:hypothetical protein